MLNKNYLLVPGPTPIPERVQNAMHIQMVNHRGPVFKAAFKEMIERVQRVFNTTTADILAYPSSGSGVMEAGIVNLFSAGDKVLVLSIGNFGDRLAEIAGNYGLDVEKISAPTGRAVCLETLQARLAADSEQQIKGILVTHNETSTGVTNDIAAIMAVCKDHPAVRMVDAVSALGAIEMRMDDWGVDVVVTGSQKALMLPPGLGFMAFGPRAWKAYEQSNLPKFYWDAGKVKKSLDKWQNPYTPPLALVFGAVESLKMIEEEGLENIYIRHERLAKMVQQAVKAMNLELLADERYLSTVVTAVKAPQGINAKDIQNKLRADYGITVAGGQRELEGKILRIGHLGYTTAADMLVVIGFLEIVLTQLGHKFELGAGVKAVQQVILEG